jgi:alkylation response protein AidB-like acyl-CoA dehydrogenase
MATILSVQDIRTNVTALLPEIATRASESEAARRVPADLVEKLRAAGCFRIGVPETFGGAGASLCQMLELYEDLAAADAAAAWIVMIGSPTASYLARFPDETIRAVYANGPDLILGVALAPTGRIARVDGGWRISGRWQWSSGSPHADLFMLTCAVEGAEPLPGGWPDMRLALLSPSDVERIDNWRVSGLRGTGSGDIAAADVFVPEARTASLFAPNTEVLRRTGMTGAAAAPYVAAVALGIAYGALSDLLALVKTNKRRLGSQTRLADEGLFQYRLGEAETALRATRAAFYAQVRTWEDFAARAPADTMLHTHPLLSATNANSVWVMKQASAIVDMAYTAGGGTSVWDSCPLQRRFRDIHTATQHISVQDAVLTRHGAALAA